MAKRYLVVVPVNKEAYLKSLNSPEKAASIIRDKIGSFMTENDVDFFEKTMTMFSAEVKNKTKLAVNERATYYASLPSAEDDIYGTAIIIGKSDNGIMGLTLEDAQEVADVVNELRV